MAGTADFDITAFRCVVCNSHQGSPVPFQYISNGRTLRGVRCRQCALIQVFPQPSAEEIAELYQEEYFTSTDAAFVHGSIDYFSRAEAAEEAYYPELMSKISAVSRGVRLLEIGCGPGHFLNYAREQGYEVLGLELSSYACEAARDRFSLDVINGDVASVDLDDGGFDVVFAGDVFEHFADPLGMAVKVRAALKPGGTLVLALPSSMNSLLTKLGFPLFRLSGRVHTVSVPPYHLIEFEPHTVREMLRKAGFSRIVVDQSCRPVRQVTLRGGLVENVSKVAIQSINYYCTKTFNRLGDRLVVLATNMSEP